MDFLGEEERAMGGMAFERKLPGFLPGSPLYGFGFESHPTTSGWELGVYGRVLGRQPLAATGMFPVRLWEAPNSCEDCGSTPHCMRYPRERLRKMSPEASLGSYDQRAFYVPGPGVTLSPGASAWEWRLSGW